MGFVLDAIGKLMASYLQKEEPGYEPFTPSNPDQLRDMLQPGERSASTTNRNFEGRQGPGALTHIMSPAMAAAAAITGHLTDVRELVS